MSIPMGITKVVKSVDIGSVAAATSGTQTVTVKGVTTSDVVIPIPPSGIEDDILPKGARVSAADTIELKVYNPTGGAIDPAAADWTFIIFSGVSTQPLPLG